MKTSNYNNPLMHACCYIYCLVLDYEIQVSLYIFFWHENWEASIVTSSVLNVEHMANSISDNHWNSTDLEPIIDYELAFLIGWSDKVFRSPNMDQMCLVCFTSSLVLVLLIVMDLFFFFLLVHWFLFCWFHWFLFCWLSWIWFFFVVH